MNQMIFFAIEIQHAYGIFLFKEQVEHGFVWIFAGELPQLDQIFPNELSVLKVRALVM